MKALKRKVKFKNKIIKKFDFENESNENTNKNPLNKLNEELFPSFRDIFKNKNYIFDENKNKNSKDFMEIKSTNTNNLKDKKLKIKIFDYINTKVDSLLNNNTNKEKMDFYMKKYSNLKKKRNSFLNNKFVCAKLKNMKISLNIKKINRKMNDYKKQIDNLLIENNDTKKLNMKSRGSLFCYKKKSNSKVDKSKKFDSLYTNKIKLNNKKHINFRKIPLKKRKKNILKTINYGKNKVNKNRYKDEIKETIKIIKLNLR